MSIIGFALIGLGLIDFVAGRSGLDIYALLGIPLTGPIATYSPVIAIGLGAVILTMVFGHNAKKVLLDNLVAGEELVLFRSANLRSPGLFGRSKHGYLFVTNKRLGFLGELPKAYKHLQTREMDTQGIVWDLREVTSFEKRFMYVTITAQGETVRFKTGAILSGQIADAIRSRL